MILAGAAEPIRQGDERPEGARRAEQAQPASPPIPKPTSTGQYQAAQEQCIDRHGDHGDCTVIATQAAVDQASYANWQTYIAIGGLSVGLATLIAAFLAARWAKEAALHTEAGANEARRAADISRETSRPWINIRVQLESLESTATRFAIRVRFTFENLGATVAKDCYTRCVISSSHENTFDAERKSFKENFPKKRDEPVNIIPGSTAGTTSYAGQAIQFFRKNMVNGKIYIHINAICVYQSEEGWFHESSGSWSLIRKAGEMGFDGGFEPGAFPEMGALEFFGGMRIAN